MNIRIRLAIIFAVLMMLMVCVQMTFLLNFNFAVPKTAVKQVNINRTFSQLQDIKLSLGEVERRFLQDKELDNQSSALTESLQRLRSQVAGFGAKEPYQKNIDAELKASIEALDQQMLAFFQLQQRHREDAANPIRTIQEFVKEVSWAIGYTDETKERELAGIVNTIRRNFLLMVLMSLVIFAGGALVLWRSVDRKVIGPINKAVKTIDRLEKGDSKARIIHRQKDEMGRFISTFNNMLDHLEVAASQSQEYVEALKHAVDQQTKELIEKNHELKLAASVFDGSLDSAAIVNESGEILKINFSFNRLNGGVASEVIGRDIADYFRDTWANFDIGTLMRHADVRGMWEGEYGGIGETGYYLAWLNIQRVSLDERKYFIFIFADITQRKLDEDKIWKQANFDSLTKLPNRAYFKEKIEQSIKLSTRTKKTLYLIFLDLDDFKRINDTLGHTAGDNLLMEVAKILRRAFRETDLMARLGGDEFAIMLEGELPESKVAHLVKNLNKMLSSRIELLDSHYSHVSGSVGIAKYPDDAEDYENLVRCADTAMYRAKFQGKNQFAFYTSDMNDQALRNMVLDSEMRQSTDDHFQLYLQAIVNDRGDPVGAEALLRWEHPTKGLISPAVFIPVAEESGFIQELGSVVIQKATDLLQQWYKKGIHLSLAVNISPKQIGNPETLNQVMESLLDAKYDNSKLAVEITENTLMSSSDQTKRFVAELRSIGVQISLDDFGTGYSSMAYLRKYSVDSIKIDRCFIDAVTYNQTDVGICESILALGQALNIKVVAEGIENEQQWLTLKSMGCRKFQGYYFSRPIPIEEFEKRYFPHLF